MGGAGYAVCGRANLPTLLQPGKSWPGFPPYSSRARLPTLARLHRSRPSPHRVAMSWSAFAPRCTQRKRAMLGIQSRRRNCRSQVCGSIPVHEDDNCVNECVSPRCYQEVYGAEPLEPGEVDLVRWQQFSSCYSLEKRDLQRQYRQGGAESASRADGSADEEADSEP